MFTLSNTISLLRAPLALLLLSHDPFYRVAAIILAMITDSIDGHLARKYQSTSRLGAILDPAMDKFFVFFALSVFVFEGRLPLWSACAMLSRDFSLCFFGIYLALTGEWGAYKFRSIRWGKISTALQFIILIALSLSVCPNPYIYTLFVFFGVLALVELFQWKKEAINTN